MCVQGTVVPMPLRGRVYDIDACLAGLIAALNAGGVSTVACCCGHGKGFGNIALEDGRELLVMPNYEAGRQIEHQLSTPPGEPSPTTSTETEQ